MYYSNFLSLSFWLQDSDCKTLTARLWLRDSDCMALQTAITWTTERKQLIVRGLCYSSAVPDWLGLSRGLSVLPSIVTLIKVMQSWLQTTYTFIFITLNVQPGIKWKGLMVSFFCCILNVKIFYIIKMNGYTNITFFLELTPPAIYNLKRPHRLLRISTRKLLAVK